MKVTKFFLKNTKQRGGFSVVFLFAKIFKLIIQYKTVAKINVNRKRFA